MQHKFFLRKKHMKMYKSINQILFTLIKIYIFNKKFTMMYKLYIEELKIAVSYNMQLR